MKRLAQTLNEAPPILDALRSQLRFVMSFKARDLRKRVLSALFLTFTLMFLEIKWPAALTLAAILTVEFLRLRLGLSLPDTDDAISNRRIVGTFILDMTATTVYCMPSILFFLSEQMTGLLLGILWLFGVTIHNVGGLALIKLWCWSALIPIIGTTTVSVVIIFLSPTYSPSDNWDAALVAIAALVYFSNIVEVMHRQRHNRDAFSTARAEAEQRLRKLEHLARHDGLTGLLNRSAFDSKLRDALREHDLDSGVSAVLLVDLDRFKEINDTLGHEAGDAILVEQARRMTEVIHDGTVARLGGDEFAILLTGLDRKDQATNVAAWLHDRLNEHTSLRGQRLDLGASIGIAFMDGAEETIAAVCSRADKAMYLAKKNRLSRPATWDEVEAAETAICSVV